MKIALLNVVNKNKKGAMNKDLAGGMGTYSCFGQSFFSKLVSYVKKRSINLPIISFAFLQAILKEKGHEVDYFEGEVIDRKYDLVLVYGSIVDFRNEVFICKNIKQRFPGTMVGFFGSFPTARPDLFNDADFVIKGEAESFFLYEFKDIKNLPKIINVKKPVDMNDLPTPDYDGFPIKEYSYFPALKEKPFLVLQASRGCPYSCSYYCAYGAIQGPNYRTRDAKKVFQDIVRLIKKYKVKGIQFRDPTFGLNKKQVEELCRLLIKNNVNIKFGMETRLDLLDLGILRLMFKAGLRNINVGVETVDENVAKINKRKLVKIEHQERVIKFCRKIGIKVSAFYILGLMGDTEDSIKKTIRYAVKLNTNVAQFAVSCPFPGTKYYDELKSNDLILETDFERYNSVSLVFKHDHLTNKQIAKLMDMALRKYYFRSKYVMEFLRWRIRELFL